MIGHSLRTVNGDSATKLDSQPQAATDPDTKQTRGGTASGSVRSDTVGRATLPSGIEDAGSVENTHISSRSQLFSLACNLVQIPLKSTNSHTNTLLCFF